MQYISSEGLLIDTIKKEVRILGSTNTISANSVAFLGETNVIANSSIGFGGSNNIASNDAIIFGGRSNNIDNSLAFSTTNSIISGDSLDFNSNNIESKENSISVRSNTSNLTSSIGFLSENDTLNNNSIVFLSKNNNTNSSVLFNSVNNTLSSNSVLFNSSSTAAGLSAIGINANFSKIQDQSIVLNSLSSITTTKSIDVLGNENIIDLNSVGIISNKSNVVNKSLSLGGNNDSVSTNSVSLQSNTNNLSGNVFSTLSNLVTGRSIASIFNSSNSTVSSNAVQINGVNNFVENNSVSIRGSNNVVRLDSVNISSDYSTVLNDSTNINGFNNTVSSKSISFNTDSSNLVNKAISINSLNSNISSASISLNSTSTVLDLSSIDILGSNNTVGNKSIAINTLNSSVKDNSISINTFDSTVFSNSVLLGGNTNIVSSNAFIINSYSSNAFTGGSVINGSTVNASSSSTSINAVSSTIVGSNSLMLGGIRHNFNSENSVYLGGENNKSANTPSGSLLGNKSIILGGENNRIGSNSIIIGGGGNDVSNNSLIIGGSGNNTENLDRVVIINRDNITPSQGNIVYLPEINALGNLTIQGNISASGNFTRVNTVTGNVSAFNVGNIMFPMVPLTVDQGYVVNNLFDVARFSFYTAPRLSVNNVGVAVNTFDRVADQALTVAGNISATQSLNLVGNLNLGLDVNLYRSAANTLKTDDNLNVGTLNVGSTNSVVTHSSNTLQTRNINPRVWDTVATFLSGSSLTNNTVSKISGPNSITNSIITDNGTNVGISNTNPSEKLTVSGNIRTTNAIILDAGTTQTNGIQFGADTNVYRSAANTLKTDDNLNVGTLNVGSTDSVVTHSSNTLQTRNINPRVWNTTAQYVSSTVANFTTNQVLKASNGAGITNSIITDDATNIGIGATDPTFKLDVNGTIRSRVTDGVILLGGGETTLGGQPSTDGFRMKYVQNLFGSDSLVFEKTDQNNSEPDGGIVFSNVGLGGVSSAALTIRGTGNIGVGTMFPNQKLTVVGSISSTGALMLSSGLTRDTGIQFGTDVSIYRSGVDRLQTDDTLVIGLSTIAPNMTRPTNETSDDVIVRNVGSGALFRREINPIIWNTTATFLSADASPTINALQKYRGSNSVEDSIIIDNGTNIGINTGTTPLGARLTVNGAISSNSTITTLGNINGTAALILAAGTTQTNGVQFGTDTNIYRSAADTLKTDDNLNVGLLATGSTNSVVTHSSNTLQTRNINPRVWDTVATFLSGSSLTNNRVAKISGPNSITNTNITDDGTTTTIAGTNFAFKNSSKFFDLYNNESDYFRFNHVTAGVLKFSYNNSTDFEVNGANSYIYTPNQLLIGTNTTGTYKLRVDGTSQFDGAAVFASTITTSAEPLIRSTRLRMGTKDHSTVFFQNEANFFILYGTNANAGNNHNSLRPFRIENTTGDTYLADSKILARHSDGKLLVNSQEVMTAATWASLVPVNTPIQIVNDIDNIDRIIISKYMAPHELAARIVSRRANSKFLIRTNVFHNGRYVTSLGHFLYLGQHDVSAANSFIRYGDSATVAIQFGTEHGLQVGDIIRIHNFSGMPAGMTSLPAAYHSNISSTNNPTFRVHTIPNSNAVQFDAYDAGANTGAARFSANNQYARVFKYRSLNAIPLLKNDNTITNSNGLFNTSIGTIYDGNSTTGHMYNTTVESLWTPPNNPPVGTVYNFEGSIVSAWGGTEISVRVNNRYVDGGVVDMKSQSSITITEIA